jgi:hypothetical protein
MLIELWEKLRGYDKWVEAQAKVESSDVEKTPVTDRYGTVIDYEYSSADMLTWTDAAGEKQYAFFTAPDDSPLYQLVDGETITIRYDPKSPDKFYLRDLLRTQVGKAVKATAVILAFVIFFGGMLILRIAGSLAQK